MKFARDIGGLKKRLAQVTTLLIISTACAIPALALGNEMHLHCDGRRETTKSTKRNETGVKGALLLRPAKHGGVYVVAHRGAHQGIPENTLPAYRKAIELGVDFVEVDVRTTKDGKLVSIHNSTIDAYVEGATGKIEDFTLAELRTFDVGSRVGPEWKGTRIPTLEEILDLCKGKCGIYLDVKNASIPRLVEMITARRMEHEVVWYAGGGELEQVEELCPGCIIMPDPGPEDRLAALIDRFKPKVIASVWKHYSRSFVEKCHAGGAIVIVDESDPSCWEDAIAWGSDGIQTDHPKALIEFLENRKKD